MPEPAPDLTPAQAPKDQIAKRISLNRRLEAGDALFDHVLLRLEVLERRRRFRRLIFYLLIWIVVIAAIVLAAKFGPQAPSLLNLK